MIKFSLSLKTTLALAFLLIALVIVLGYSLLSINFFFRGMDSIMSVNMEKALQTYLHTVEADERNKLIEFSGYNISPEWNLQPEEIRQIFHRPPNNTSDLQLSKDQPFPLRPSVVYFLISLKINDQLYFVSHKVTAEETSPLIGKNARESKQILYGITFSMTLLLLLIVWMLLRKFSQPIKELMHWTHNLTPSHLKQPIPNFTYPELNEMSVLIQKSLVSVNDSLEREHNFLRFTSHELRTPISVIRNNIQLARKLESADNAFSVTKNKEILDRIDRASLTMQHLSETLLWLSKNDVDKLSTESLRVDELIASIIDELQYLLKSKNVEVVTELSVYKMILPRIATHIVISNLIRNAFQHTWSGKIVITQQKDTISIINSSNPSQFSEQNSDQGFGLGLQLTEALCNKLKWQYQSSSDIDGYKATLTLKP